MGRNRKIGSAHSQLFTNLISVFYVYTKLETVSQNTILIKTALMFIPVQVLLDKLIISSMSIHPGILISVSMPAHQMSKLHFLSLL